jgi:methionine aminopeptidase type I
MTVHIKTKAEQDKMRAAGKLAAQTLDMLESHVIEGVTTAELDKLVHDFTLDHNAVPATLGYHGFPASCCISINDVACHGIPDETILQNGDIVNIDVTPKLEGWHGDTSKMFQIGDVSEDDRDLCNIAHEAMWAGIDAIEVGRDIRAIGRAISLYMSKTSATIAKEFCGHGTGLVFHEEPQILHFATLQSLGTITPGMTFTIEPIINAGTAYTQTSEVDNWTVTTHDGRKSAQWEHTILILEDGFEILTLREEENNG